MLFYVLCPAENVFVNATVLPSHNQLNQQAMSVGGTLSIKSPLYNHCITHTHELVHYV